MRKKIFFLFLTLLFSLFQTAAQKSCNAMEKMAIINKRMHANHIDSSGRGLADMHYLWNPGAVLQVKFLSGDSILQSKVKAAASEWMKYANVHFQFVNSGAANVRILLGKGNGHSSYIGRMNTMILEKSETMNLDTTDFVSDSLLRATVLHEFGHALGLLHEHASPISGIKWDKEKIYESYLSDYGWSSKDVDEQVFETYSSSYTNGTTYDRKSIMHYPIEPWQTLDGYVVPWNLDISQGDKELVAALYPKDGIRKNEIPRITISNFKKLKVRENKAKGGLSIFPRFIMSTAGKSLNLYLLVEFFDEYGNYLEDTDGKFSFENRVVALRSLRTIPGKKSKFNKGLNKLEIFIPYEQIELQEPKKGAMRFRIVQQTDEGEIKDVFYGHTDFFVLKN